MIKSLIIIDNKDGSVIFQVAQDEFSKHHEDVVVGFLRSIDSWAKEYSGKGADVFQTKTIRITFDKSIEFDLTFAFCTDLSNPMVKDKQRLEEIKYTFIHQFWEIFTSDKRRQLSEEDNASFLSLLESLS